MRQPAADSTASTAASPQPLARDAELVALVVVQVGGQRREQQLGEPRRVELWSASNEQGGRMQAPRPVGADVKARPVLRALQCAQQLKVVVDERERANGG